MLMAALLLLSLLLIPMPSFDAPLSTVVEAADGTLLGARVAADGQWRFPPPDTLPAKYVISLINYEDRHFYHHPGVNPVALGKALAANLRAGRSVRGGSTITMQVARMARGSRRRTYGGKLLETLMALKLELFRSKQTILRLYAANAPYGGNTVGLEAAVWRYTGAGTGDLSWAAAATLAVLPNSPALIHPGRNAELLRDRRDRLLMTLAARGIIDTLTCSLAMEEPLPGAPLPMPSLAPHLTDRLWREQPGRRITTTIDSRLQHEVTALVNSHVKMLEGNGIYNAAAIVTEIATGNVIARAGNSTLPDSSGTLGRDVDIITSPRSTGSILKPLLYAGLLSSGELLPNALLPDIPTRFHGFRPENADFSYSGAVPAGDALARSLNIPAVRMLQMYHEERFLELLHQMGFTTFNKPAAHYGLSLILGGGEATLQELANAYATLARIVTGSNKTLDAAGDNSSGVGSGISSSLPSAAAIWLTYEALRRVNRPETETGWQYFGGAREVAWKTGTSYGFRDAWAIGTTPDYVVAIWAGNANGEGRPGLTGISAAAPLLFDIIRRLPPSTAWFPRPEEGMALVKVCAASGYRAGSDCTETREEWVPEPGLRSRTCPWHIVVNLDATGSFRVSSACTAPGEMRAESWFVLPPAMEYYYRMRNPSYRVLPPLRPGCPDDREITSMEFIYPPADARIFIPRSLSGELMAMLPEAAHRRRDAILYWHLDNQYLGMTREIHQREIRVGAGEHLLTIVDEQGKSITRRFYCVGSL